MAAPPGASPLLQGLMNHQPRTSLTAVALWAVVALLLANLLVMVSRSDTPSFLQPAWGAQQPPIAGGAGLFVMPAQLSGNNWGCYLMDVDRGTLCVYQYHPGSRRLEFVSARNFINDTKLQNYNTAPTPQEILDLVNKQAQAIRGAAPAPGAPTERQENGN